MRPTVLLVTPNIGGEYLVTPDIDGENLHPRYRRRKVDARLPGKGNSNSDDEKPVHTIITMIKWIRTSTFLIKNSLSRRSSREKMFTPDTDGGNIYPKYRRGNSPPQI